MTDPPLSWTSEPMSELTMCECGHAAIHHYSHGRCGVEYVMCSCLNLVPREENTDD